MPCLVASVHTKIDNFALFLLVSVPLSLIINEQVMNTHTTRVFSLVPSIPNIIKRNVTWHPVMHNVC